MTNGLSPYSTNTLATPFDIGMHLLQLVSSTTMLVYVYRGEMIYGCNDGC